MIFTWNGTAYDEINTRTVEDMQDRIAILEAALQEIADIANDSDAYDAMRLRVLGIAQQKAPV